MPACFGEQGLHRRCKIIQAGKFMVSPMRKLRLCLICIGIAGVLAGCDNNTPLMKSVLDDDVESVRKILDGGQVDVDKRNRYGWTALMHAARVNNATLVELLLQHGANVDARDDDGWTPLIRAAMKGSTAVIKVLLAHGADIDARNKSDWTALQWAVMKDRNEAARLLLQHGADVSIKNNSGWTARMLAIRNENPELINLLEKAGAKE